MKRSNALNAMKFAGYHGDKASLARLFIENRVSRASADAAWMAGAAARGAGMSCGCTECRDGSTP